MGFKMGWKNSAEIMDEIARLTPTFAHVSFKMLDERVRSNGLATTNIPMDRRSCSRRLHRGKGHLGLTEYVPTDERTSRVYR